MSNHSKKEENDDEARRRSSSLSECDWVRQSQLLLQRIFFVNDNNNHSAAAHTSSSTSSPLSRPKSANQDVPQPSKTPPLLVLSDDLAVTDDAANDDGEDAEVPSFLDFGIQSSGSDDVEEEEEHADLAAPDALAAGVQAREDHWTLEDNYWFWTRELRFDFELLHPALLHHDDEGRTTRQQNGSTSTHESVGSSSSPWTSRRKMCASFAFPATQRAWSSAVLAEGRMRRNTTVDDDDDDDDGKAVSSKEKGTALCASSPSSSPPKAVGALPNGNGNGGSGCTVVSLPRERKSSGPLPRREAEEEDEEEGGDDPGALLLFQHDSIAIKFLLFPLPSSMPQRQQQQQQRRERDHEEEDHVSNHDGALFEVTRCTSLLQEVALHASLPLDSLHLLPCYGGGVAVLEEQQPQPQQDGNVHNDDSSRIFVQEVSYFCNRGGSRVCGDGMLASSCSSSSSSLSFSLVRADSPFPMMNGIVTMDNDEEEEQRCSAVHCSATFEHPSKPSSPTKEKEPPKKRRAVIVFLLMEHAGMTLSQRAISRPFRSFHDDAVLRVLKQLSSALGVLSQVRREKQEDEDEIKKKKKNESPSADAPVPCEDCCQVVHGDLKPQNVYLRSPSAVAFLTAAAAKKKQKKTNFLHKNKVCEGEQQCNSYHEMEEGEEEQEEGIISGDEVWALADFGCATRIVKKKKTILSGSTTNASTDTTLLLSCPLRDAYAGTVLYMSPEVASGAVDRTVQSDIWSLGVLAVWLLTKGELPWAPLERQLPSLLLHQLRDAYFQFHRQLSSQQWHSEKEEQEAATTVLGPVLLSTLCEMKSAFVARRKRQEEDEEEKGEGTHQQSMEHATVEDREEALVRLIRQCLLMSPPHRPTAAQFYVTLGSLMFCAESGGQGNNTTETSKTRNE